MFGRATITLGIGPHSSLFLVPSLLFLFGSARQTKLAIRQLFGAYGVSCRTKFHFWFNSSVSHYNGE